MFAILNVRVISRNSRFYVIMYQSETLQNSYKSNDPCYFWIQQRTGLAGSHYYQMGNKRVY